MSKEAIARELKQELGNPSRSGILAYIKKLGLRTVPGNREVENQGNRCAGLTSSRSGTRFGTAAAEPSKNPRDK